MASPQVSGGVNVREKFGVGSALLVMLDSLAPAERVVFVLHDIFAVPFDEVATIVDRSPDACHASSQAVPGADSGGPRQQPASTAPANVRSSTRSCAARVSRQAFGELAGPAGLPLDLEGHAAKALSRLRG